MHYVTRLPDQLGNTNGINLQVSIFTSPLAADRGSRVGFSLP
jgi:hypothetical protein